MPRQPTGRPPGRPRGSGQLENPTRVTVWLSSETYARLEAYADGRHFHRGEPQLSSSVRELLVHALACPYKNQTHNIPVLHGDNNRPIENVLAGAQNNSEQIETITATPENNYYEQIETVPMVSENNSEQIETVHTPATHKTRPVTDTVTDTHVQAEAVWTAPGRGHVTDTVTDMVTDMVTDTHAQAETWGTAPGAGHVTDTVTDTVAVPPATRKAPARSAVTATVSDTVTVTEAKHRGRKPVLREPILALLREYPNGLTAAQLKVYLDTEKHIGDTLSGMVKAELLVKDSSGKAVRYLLADSVETSSRP